MRDDDWSLRVNREAGLIVLTVHDVVRSGGIFVDQSTGTYLDRAEVEHLIDELQLAVDALGDPPR